MTGPKYTQEELITWRIAGCSFGPSAQVRIDAPERSDLGEVLVDVAAADAPRIARVFRAVSLADAQGLTWRTSHTDGRAAWEERCAAALSGRGLRIDPDAERRMLLANGTDVWIAARPPTRARGEWDVRVRGWRSGPDADPREAPRVTLTLGLSIDITAAELTVRLGRQHVVAAARAVLNAYGWNPAPGVEAAWIARRVADTLRRADEHRPDQGGPPGPE
jgi:hypothetical protein